MRILYRITLVFLLVSAIVIAGLRFISPIVHAQQAVFVPNCIGNATSDTAAFTAIKTTLGTTVQGSIRIPRKANSAQRCHLNDFSTTENITIDNSDGDGVFIVTGKTLTLGGPLINPAGKRLVYNANAGQGTLVIGGTAIDTLYPQIWGAFPSNSAANNNAPLQAFFVALGAGKVNGTGQNNRKGVITGNFHVSTAISLADFVGFNLGGENKLYSGFTQEAVNTKLFNANHIAYGTFDNLSFTAAASQNTGLIDLYSTDSSDLSPQNIRFNNCVFSGAGLGYIGVWIARTGGGSQGDSISFDNSVFTGFTESAIELGGDPSNCAPSPKCYAYNAIHVGVKNSDFQANPKHALAAYGGSFIGEDVIFENGNWTSASGLTQTACELYSEASQNINTLTHFRSESVMLACGNWKLTDGSILGPQTTFTTPWTGLPGTVSFQHQLVTGTPYGGDGKMYEVTSSPIYALNYTDILTPFSTTVLTVTGPLVVNAYAGLLAQVKYPNCYAGQYRTVTSNTATTITVPALDFTPADSPGEPCGTPSQVRIISTFPTFGGLGSAVNATVTGATNASPIVITTSGASDFNTGDSVTISGVLGNTAANGTWTITKASSTTFSLTTSTGNGAYTSGGTASATRRATSGSSTTIVSSGANWTNSAFVGSRVTIVAGAGKYQYGVITANNGTTITAGAGWVTDYKRQSTGLPVLIVSPDSTSQFVVEPNWNGGTVTSGTASMTAYDYSVLQGCDPSVCGANAPGQFIVDRVSFGYGGRANMQGTITNSSFTRADWIYPHDQMDTSVAALLTRGVTVQRPGAVGGEYIPWSVPSSNGYVGPSDSSQDARGREWINWKYGDDVNITYPAVGIGPCGGAPYTDGNSFSLNMLCIRGTLGSETPFGTNQNGTPLRLQPGLATGSGTAGRLEFWAGPTAGASGTATRVGSRIGYFDYLGLHLDSGSFFGPHNGTVGADSPAAGTFTSLVVSGAFPSRSALNLGFGGATVAGSSTKYSSPSNDSATESTLPFPMPYAGTLRNLMIYTDTAQPGDGALVCTARKNGADTAVTFTIAAAAVAGWYGDLTHSVAFAQKDLLTVKCVNASASTSARKTSLSVEYDTP